MKRNYFLICIISAITFFSSCSASKNSTAPTYQSDILQDGSVRHYGASRLYEEPESDKALKAKRKVIFNANLSMAVKIIDTANSNIEKIAAKHGGYVNQIGTYQTIIRVKSENLKNAIEDISKLGKLQSKSISGQDVTEDYLDYEIRLENAEKSRNRYLELLAKAENVETTLKVEKELERLNETIDLLKGKMNRINHLDEYSTITIHLVEKKKSGIIGYVFIGLYHSVKWLFVRN